MNTALICKLLSMSDEKPPNETASSPPGNAALSELIVRLMHDVVQARREIADERELRLGLECELAGLRQTVISNFAHQKQQSGYDWDSDKSHISVISPSSSAFAYIPDSKVEIVARSTPADLPPRPLDQRAQLNHQLINGSAPDEEDTSDGDEFPRLNLLQALNITTPADEEKVVTVRKVHKLGFRSQNILRRHFSRYGSVADVVLLPMRARPKASADGITRGARPSSMGFVVMQTATAAQAALRTPVQEVHGWPIEVRAFVRPAERPPLP